MTVCKSIRDKVAFKFIRFGFRTALNNIAVVDENDIDNLVKEMVGEG